MVLSSRGAAPAPSPRRHDRFVELDGLRGIAACSVVALHFSTLFDRFFPGHERFPVHFLWGGLGVQLFFMISGFVITVTTTRHPTPARFVRARAIRLYPTYWACLTLTVLITWAQNGMTQPWKVTLLNYTMLQSFLRVRDLDGSYWSLAAEITFYALVAALLLLSRRGLDRRRVTALIVTWLLCEFVLHAGAQETASTVCPLYLLHQNIGYVVLLHTADPLGPWLSRAVAFTVIVVLAWIVHEVVEVRLGKALTRRFEPRRPARSHSVGSQ